MFNVLTLNIIVLLFALLTIVWQQSDLKLSKTQRVSNRLNPIILLIFLISWFIVLVYFLINADDEFRRIFLTYNLSILLVANTLWITAKKDFDVKILAIFLTACFFLLKLTLKNLFIDNVFILMSTLWVGPFLIKINLLNQKRFVIISLLWLLYDIYFIWLSPTFKDLLSQTREVNFTLGIVVGKYMIGAGDLLYMNMLLSILKDNKSRIISSLVLILSSFVLFIIAIKTGTALTFPLLVLWVPLGTLLLVFFRKSF